MTPGLLEMLQAPEKFFCGPEPIFRAGWCHMIWPEFFGIFCNISPLLNV
jgi:hypothetical protein